MPHAESAAKANAKTSVRAHAAHGSGARVEGAFLPSEETGARTVMLSIQAQVSIEEESITVCLTRLNV